MGLFGSKEEREQRKKQAAERRMKSVAAEALRARKEGQTIFQFIDLIDTTEGMVVPMVGAYTLSREEGIASSKAQSSSTAAERSRRVPIIQLIEEQGWQLIHAGYVFQETGSESRDKFLESGQQIAVSGRILGIYLFRALETDN